MGFFESLFGGSRKLKAPAPDRLFAMTTAQVTLESGLGLTHRRRSGIVFQALATADFEEIMRETEELVGGTAEETDTKVERHEDDYGYRWVILNDPDFEDLVVSLNTVSGQLQTSGYGDRLLCCVFAFEKDGKPIYFIYLFKRGTFYPFVPSGKDGRDTEAELRLIAQLGAELPIEQEPGYRYPLSEIPV